MPEFGQRRSAVKLLNKKPNGNDDSNPYNGDQISEKPR